MRRSVYRFSFALLLVALPVAALASGFSIDLLTTWPLAHWTGPHMDTYCERRGTGWLAEPVNALTNFCIIGAGFYILRLYYRDIVAKYHRHYPMFLALIGLVVALGVGSLIWHTIAGPWGLWADLVPIAALIYAYQWAVLRLVFRWSRRETTIYLIVFTAVQLSLTAGFGEEALNGSIIYVPAVSALIWFGVQMRRERKRGNRYMVYAVLTFVCAIALRTMDMAVCSWFPIGTHFFWHLGNSLLVYFLAQALIHGYAGGGTRRPFMGATPPARRKAKWTM